MASNIVPEDPNAKNHNSNNINANSNATSDRNFRMPYYQKVGCCKVDDKSLELLFDQNPVDRSRLAILANRFVLPPPHREKVWLLMLDVSNSRKHDYILEEQRKIQLHLERALNTLLDAPLKSDEQRLVLMYLIDIGKYNIEGALESLNTGANRPLLNIASAITNADPKFELKYTIFRGIIKLIASVDTNEMVSKVLCDLANTSALSNDNQNLQCSSLCSAQSPNGNQDENLSHKKYNCLPLKQMLESCFASYIPQSLVIKVWDKIIAGNVSKVMTNFTRELLLAHIDHFTSLDQVIEMLQKFQAEKCDQVFFKVCQNEG